MSQPNLPDSLMWIDRDHGCEPTICLSRTPIRLNQTEARELAGALISLASEIDRPVPAAACAEGSESRQCAESDLACLTRELRLLRAMARGVAIDQVSERSDALEHAAALARDLAALRQLVDLSVDSEDADDSIPDGGPPPIGRFVPPVVWRRVQAALGGAS